MAPIIQEWPLGIMIDELAYGPLSLQVALRFRILGDLMREMGGLMDARSCFQHALEINEKLYGSNSREVVETLINLVEIAKAQEDSASAKKYYERASQIYRNSFGESHSPQSFSNALEALG